MLKRRSDADNISSLWEVSVLSTLDEAAPNKAVNRSGEIGWI